MGNTVSQNGFEIPVVNTGFLDIQIPFSLSDRNTLLIDVAKESVDTTDIQGYAGREGFEAKDAYHFTVVGDAVGKLLHERLETMVDENERTALLDRVNGLTVHLGKAKLKPTEYYRLLKSFDYNGLAEQREAIIQEADIEGIDDFYSAFSQLTGIELGTPYPHLTLFTKGASEESRKGIGIRSVKYLDTIQHHKIDLST